MADGSVTRLSFLLSVIVKKSSPKNLSADCRSTVGRQVTDSLPTANQLVKKKEKIVLKTNTLPTVGRLSVHSRPTGSLYFGQNLSAVCQPTVGRQTADCRPTVGRQTTNCQPTVGQQSADSWPTVGRQVFWGALLHNYPFISLKDKSVTSPVSNHDWILWSTSFSGIIFRVQNNSRLPF